MPRYQKGSVNNAWDKAQDDEPVVLFGPPKPSTTAQLQKALRKALRNLGFYGWKALVPQITEARELLTARGVTPDPDTEPFIQDLDRRLTMVFEMRPSRDLVRRLEQEREIANDPNAPQWMRDLAGQVERAIVEIIDRRADAEPARMAS